MKTKTRLLTVAACLALTSGCISTTTGTSPPEANDTNAAELNYQLGARYYQSGKYELARDRLLLSIELDPKRPLAYTTLALTYEALGNLRLATQNYERAVDAAPRDFDVRNTYAVFLCRQQDYAAAQKNFEQAAQHPENDNAEVTLTNAGVCMAQKPDVAQAEDYFRRALNRRSEYGEALLQMCLLKFQNSEYLSSRAFLQRYMGSNPVTPGVLYLGSEIELKLGDERARRDYVDRLLREFPQSPEARKALGSG
jgi:type IV pilus assembly protein PilF